MDEELGMTPQQSHWAARAVEVVRTLDLEAAQILRNAPFIEHDGAQRLQMLQVLVTAYLAEATAK
jgi:hypothetical protein